MKRLSGRDFPVWAAKSLPAEAVVLLAGDDPDAKSRCRRDLYKARGIDPRDAFALVRLSGAEALEGRLADELGAVSMFGGSRIVEVSATARQAGELAALALSLPRRDVIAVIDAPEAPPVDGGDDLALVDCAPPTEAQLLQSLERKAEELGLPTTTPWWREILHAIASEPVGAETQLEKLALYARSAPLDGAVARTIVGDGEAAALEAVAAAALAGRVDLLAELADHAQMRGDDPAGQILALQRALGNALRGKLRGWSGAADHLSPDEVRRLLGQNFQAVRLSRADTFAGKLLARRALLATAMAARRGRRR